MGAPVMTCDYLSVMPPKALGPALTQRGHSTNPLPGSHFSFQPPQPHPLLPLSLSDSPRRPSCPVPVWARRAVSREPISWSLLTSASSHLPTAGGILWPVFLGLTCQILGESSPWRGKELFAVHGVVLQGAGLLPSSLQQLSNKAGHSPGS